MWAQIAIMVVSTLVSFIMRPSAPKQKPPEVQTPEAKEGTSIRKIYGTVWIDDPQWLGFQKVGRDRIRKKGGKK